MIRKSRLLSLTIATIIASAPVVTFSATHWATTLVTNFQKEHLLTQISTDPKTLESNMTGKQFDQMILDIATAKKIQLKAYDHSAQKNITRLKAAEILYDLFQSQYPSLKPIQTPTTFKDVKTKNENSLKALEWTTQMGLMKGYKDGTFQPESFMKLGEGVALVNELKKWLVAGEASIQKPDPTPQTIKGTIAKDVTYKWTQDTDGTCTLNLSWGEKPTGGYAITVDHVELDGTSYTVYVKLSTPKEGAIVTQALTYPAASIKTAFKLSETDTLKVFIYQVK